MEIAERELQNFISPNQKREITAQLIIEVVAEHFNITVDQMASKNRSASLVRPRQIAMYLCNTLTDDSLQAIGLLLGGRDHSTIIHGANKISDDMEKDDNIKNAVETIKKKINPNWWMLKIMLITFLYPFDKLLLIFRLKQASQNTYFLFTFYQYFIHG